MSQYMYTGVWSSTLAQNRRIFGGNHCTNSTHSGTGSGILVREFPTRYFKKFHHAQTPPSHYAVTRCWRLLSVSLPFGIPWGQSFELLSQQWLLICCCRSHHFQSFIEKSGRLVVVGDDRAVALISSCWWVTDSTNVCVMNFWVWTMVLSFILLFLLLTSSFICWCLIHTYCLFFKVGSQ